MVIFFYIFAFLMISSAILVINSKNPVHAVLWLIFAFCNGSGLLVLIGAEFIAMMLIIIYVGAVAVLFLFVVMMLDVKITAMKSRLQIGCATLLALLLFADLALIASISTKLIDVSDSSRFAIRAEVPNAYAIGRVLYTDFVVAFQTCGLILFVAMIASIVLTMRLRPGVKRQNVAKQLASSKKNNLFFAKEAGKEGLDNLNYDD